MNALSLPYRETALLLPWASGGRQGHASVTEGRSRCGRSGLGPWHEHWVWGWEPRVLLGAAQLGEPCIPSL